MSDKLEVATLGAGCFWCVEAVFREVKGVVEVVSGYAGGNVPHPTYEQVCRGTTGHAEAVRITFDPEVITYIDILDIFWSTHDPTTKNRQGHDVGAQYRSVIFFHDDGQKACAESSKRKMEESGLFAGPIVTEIVPFTNFFKADEYHQDYFGAKPDQPYCRVVIDPKIRKFRNVFQDKLKAPSAEGG